MNAPPVQYTKTSDGYSIAYMTSGEGPAIVMLPQLFQHSQRLWAGGPFAGTLAYLARRFRVVQYDSRGQGMSQRGLPEDHDADAYVRDLEAVFEALRLERAVLHGNSYFGRTALQFAARHPERVSGLVLHNVAVVGGGFMVAPELRVLAVNDWEVFLLITARSVFPRNDTQGMIEYFHLSASQADHLKLLNTAESSIVSEAVARQIAAPTLLIGTAPGPTFESSDRGRELARLIAASRLVSLERPYARQGESTAMALQVEAFVDEIVGGDGEQRQGSLGLSVREVEVLRLIASGKSNPQIAEELTLSINTVQRHVSNILAKTGLANRAEAAAYAARNGLAD